MPKTNILRIWCTLSNTVKILYSGSNNPVVFQLEMPADKCNQPSDIYAATEADYTRKSHLILTSIINNIQSMENPTCLQ